MAIGKKKSTGSKRGIMKSAKAKAPKKEKVVKENPEGTITLTDAMAILEKKKIVRSRQAVRSAAITQKFLSKHEGSGREKILLDVAGFRAWLANGETKIPNGWVTRKEGSKLTGLSTARLYALIKRFNISSGFYGPGKGNLCFDLEKLKKALAEEKKGKTEKKPTKKPVTKTKVKVQEKKPTLKKKPAIENGGVDLDAIRDPNRDPDIEE